MANYKDKIGELPREWTAVKANKHLILESGMRPSKYVTDNVNDIPSLGGENIHEDGYLIFDNVRYISIAYYIRMPKGQILDKDILINKDGANTGKIAFAKEKPFSECAVNEHLFIIRNKGEFDQNFLFYFLFSEKGNNQILRKIVGSAQGGINNSFPKGIFLPKPPKPEQTAIATILSKVDEAIEATQNSIKAAEKLKKALMQNLLTGKLKPDGAWRKEDEFYDDEKFGKVPEGWIYDKVKNLTNRVTDGEHLSPDFQDSGSYLLSAEDILDDGVSFSKAKFVKPDDCNKFRKRCDPEFGDVLIVSRGAGIGRTCKVGTPIEFCLMGSVILIKPNNDILHGGFLAQYFKTYQAWIELQKLSGTTAQQAIYLTHIKKVKLIYPENIAEQELISSKLETFDISIAEKETKIHTLQRLKKSLMQNLLTGKVRLDVEVINKIISEQ